MAEPGNFKFRERWQKQVRKDPQVTKDRLAVALLISTEARGDGTRALMSQEQLAKNLGVSVPTVERRIRELKELGYLEVAQRGGHRGDGTKAANIYNLSQPLTQMMGSDGSQPISQMMDRDSQQDTPMSGRGGTSTHQNSASTHQNSASTHHPGDGPLFNPSSNPNGMDCLTADAARPNGNTREPFTDWRAEDEDLFRQVMLVDHVTQRGQQYTINGLYQAIRKQGKDWPGRYLKEMADRSEAVVDEYLQFHFDIDRWADYNP